MCEPVSVLGLLGLFNVCLEGYKLCLTAKDADSDFAILRTRMFLERERFVNVCAAFGLAGSENSGRAKALRQYIERDAFRRKGIADALEAVSLLLARAEKADRMYSDREEIPDVAKDKKVRNVLVVRLVLCVPILQTKALGRTPSRIRSIAVSKYSAVRSTESSSGPSAIRWRMRMP